MADGFAALDAHIARVRALADLSRAAAPECALEAKDAIDAQIARGVGPDGEAWPPRKDTGERTLQNAAQAVVVVPVGNTVFFRVRGPEARHHLGHARGGVVRRILPVKGIPNHLALAIKRGLTRKFEQTMGVG